MRAAFITTNLGGGGAERAMVNLASLLAQRGHDSHLILLEHIIEHPLGPGIQLHTLSRPGQERSKAFPAKQLTAGRLRRLFGKLSREAPFDLVVSTLPYADEITEMARLPRAWHRIANTLSAEVVRIAATDPRRAARRERKYRRLYHGRNLVAVSEGVLQDLRERIGLTSANMVRIYNPFDLAAIRRLAAEPVPNRPAEPYVVHVGRCAPQKRHDLLFEAWKQLRTPCKLLLLTHPEPKLEALIARYGLQNEVVVAGFQPNPYPWIRGARLLVLASDHEGLPNVLVEALACGTPVVSTDCPSGPREIMTPPLDRFLVPVGNATGLARALSAALESPPDVASFDLTKFDAQTVAAQYENLATLWREDG